MDHPSYYGLGCFKNPVQLVTTMLNGMDLGKKRHGCKCGENFRADGGQARKTGVLSVRHQFRRIEVKSPWFYLCFLETRG